MQCTTQKGCLTYHRLLRGHQLCVLACSILVIRQTRLTGKCRLASNLGLKCYQKLMMYFTSSAAVTEQILQRKGLITLPFGWKTFRRTLEFLGSKHCDSMVNFTRVNTWNDVQSIISDIYSWNSNISRWYVWIVLVNAVYNENSRLTTVSTW